MTHIRMKVKLNVSLKKKRTKLINKFDLFLTFYTYIQSIYNGIFACVIERYFTDVSHPTGKK